jgi:hypothetical protein
LKEMFPYDGILLFTTVLSYEVGYIYIKKHKKGVFIHD